MYPQILSLILHDKRFLLLDRDCSKRTDLFYYQSPKKKELFQRACKIGKIDIVKSLFPHVDSISFRDRIANFNWRIPSADNNFAIQMAANNGHIEVVKILFNHVKVYNKLYWFQKIFYIIKIILSSNEALIVAILRWLIY